MRSVVTFVLVVTLWRGALAAEPTKDSLATVRQALAEKKAVLLDVREVDEWNAGHLKDARLLPLSRIRAGLTREQAETAGLEAKKIIYCHCRSGRRTLTAADELKKLGYDVRPLGQGFEDLLSAGFAKAP